MAVQKTDIEKCKRCRIYNDKIHIDRLPSLGGYPRMDGYRIRHVQTLNNTDYCEIEVDTTFVTQNHHFMLSPLFIIYVPLTHLWVYGEYLLYCSDEQAKMVIQTRERREYMAYAMLFFQMSKYTHHVFTEKSIQHMMLEYIFGSYLNGLYKCRKSI
jgi:hypothetical protein